MAWLCWTGDLESRKMMHFQYYHFKPANLISENLSIYICLLPKNHCIIHRYMWGSHCSALAESAAYFHLRTCTAHHCGLSQILIQDTHRQGVGDGVVRWGIVTQSYQGMDGPIMAEKPTNLFLLEAATSDKGARRLLRNFAKVGALQFGDLSLWVMSHCFRTFQNAIFPLSASENR